MPDKRKVLIIDDDRPLTQLYAAQLRQAGYAALIAEDAMQGFMFAQREMPDAILLDVNMPAGGGMMLFDKLNKSVKTSGTPVVIVTASTDPKIDAEGKAKGARAVLRKPVDKDTLLAELARVFDSAP